MTNFGPNDPASRMRAIADELATQNAKLPRADHNGTPTVVEQRTMHLVVNPTAGPIGQPTTPSASDRGRALPNHLKMAAAIEARNNGRPLGDVLADYADRFPGGDAA